MLAFLLAAAASKPNRKTRLETLKTERHRAWDRYERLRGTSRATEAMDRALELDRAYSDELVRLAAGRRS